MTALLLGEVFLESGLPKNAFQVVPMNTDYIDTVLNDERVKMISFTGSDSVGWDLKSKTKKKAVSLELGGNAPVIIDESADLEKAIERTTITARSLTPDKLAFPFRELFCTKKSLMNLPRNLSKKRKS